MTAADRLLPPEATAWDEMHARPVRFAPWPYTDSERGRIVEILSATGCANAGAGLDEALLATRWYLDRKRLAIVRAEPAKPDAARELAAIRDAIESLIKAIKAASPDAERYLTENPSPGSGVRPPMPRDLLSALFHLEHSNRFAFRNLPEEELKGRPEKRTDQILLLKLWDGWEIAHAGNAPARGWPAFREACIKPLFSQRFPNKYHPEPRSDRAWQSLLQQARKWRMAQENLLK